MRVTPQGTDQLGRNCFAGFLFALISGDVLYAFHMNQQVRFLNTL